MSLKDKMTALADAIRSKTGGTEALTLDQMAEDVAAIEVRLPEQGKQATPSLEEQIITPDEGKAINQVIIAPITGELLEELDEDFKAENIAKDVEVFGKIGTAVAAKTCSIILNKPLNSVLSKGTATFYYTKLVDSNLQSAITTLDVTEGGTIENVICGSFLAIHLNGTALVSGFAYSGLIDLDWRYGLAGVNGILYFFEVTSIGGEQCSLTPQKPSLDYD